MRIQFIIILFILSAFNAYSQELRTIGVNDGLSSMIVRNITQDDMGMLWIATQWGIQSYNGSSFKDYDVYNMKGVTGTSDNRFLLIQYDMFDRLWAMNRNQLFLYDSQLDNFTEIFSIPDKKNAFIEAMELHIIDSLNLYVVTSNELYHYHIGQYKLNNVYDAFGAHSFVPFDDEYALIATHDGFLYMKMRTDQILATIPDHPFQHQIPARLDLRKIKRDGYGNIWLATYTKGIYIITPDNRIVKPEWDMISKHYRVLDIVSYDNKIAIAVDGFGLLFCDPEFNLLYTIEANDMSFSLSNSGVQSLFVDNEERLWISTFGGGINCVDPHVSPFRTIQHVSNQVNSISNDMVRSIYEDTEGNIWFGTKEGVSVLNPQTQTWKHLNSRNNVHFNSNSTMAITEDSQGYMWISTFAGGITICDKNLNIKNKFTTINSGLKSDDIFVLYIDREGDIWISGENGTLTCYLYKSREFIYYDINSRVRTITQSESGDILVSGLRGVQKINKKENTVEEVFAPKNQNKHIMVYSVLEDSKGRLWFATDGMGVICWENRDKRTHTFTVENGLTSNVCYCLLEDQSGNIWTSTQIGINCISGEDYSLRSFSARNAFHGQLREFLYCSFASLQNGQLLFGGFNGCVIFNPLDINNDTKTYPLIFTDFKLFNHSVVPQERGSILRKSINLTEKIVLDYTENTFSIDFATINFSKIAQNRYSWILEGVDKDWTPYTDRNTAYYTNLSPGTYQFRVKSTLVGGKYSERTLILVVSSPWWSTSWAYVFYILILLLIVRFAMGFYKSKIIASQAKEKTDFFIHIAHDLKTPLSLIMLPLATIKKQNAQDEAIDHELDIAIKNTERLKKLVNQLLQFEKASSKRVKLQVGKYRAEASIESITKAFDSVAEKKKIDFAVQLPEVTTWLWFDMDKFEKILYNLLDNAFKYTPQGGTIRLKARVGSDSYVIEVQDSGIGIHDTQKTDVFKKYFRASNAINSKIPGSGVGLLIVRELLKLHGGSISFSSKEGQGTTFTISFPLGKKHFEGQTGIDYVEQLSSPISSETPESGSEKCKILLVEDNPELLSYMKQNLDSYYQVETAQNGLEAVHYMETELPDIVVTDYMMPEMNGIELCKKIKSTAGWQAIPVIILTALSSNEHKIDGYTAGADAYIEKPFDILVLRSRLENLLMSRSLLKMNVLKSFDQNRFSFDDQNQQFMDQVNKIILEHLSDTEFSIDTICEAVNMSHSTFYRKIRELRNQSPAELINELRMNKAAELLRTGKYNVSEVAYMTGFSFPNYFSKVFKRFYGCNPNELIAK